MARVTGSYYNNCGLHVQNAVTAMHWCRMMKYIHWYLACTANLLSPDWKMYASNHFHHLLES